MTKKELQELLYNLAIEVEEPTKELCAKLIAKIERLMKWQQAALDRLACPKDPWPFVYCKTCEDRRACDKAGKLYCQALGDA